MTADDVLPTGPPCPECAQGKHVNCDGSTWDPDNDAPAVCACAIGGHETDRSRR